MNFIDLSLFFTIALFSITIPILLIANLFINNEYLENFNKKYLVMFMISLFYLKIIGNKTLTFIDFIIIIPIIPPYFLFTLFHFIVKL